MKICWLAEATLTTICHFLGESFDESMLLFHQNPDLYDTDEVNRGNLAKPLLVGNSNKWRTTMKPEEIRVFEGVAGEWLARTGYRAVLDQARMPALERFYRRYGDHPPRKLWAMIKNRRGHREERARLRIVLRRTLGALFVRRRPRPTDAGGERPERPAPSLRRKGGRP